MVAALSLATVYILITLTLGVITLYLYCQKPGSVNGVAISKPAECFIAKDFSEIFPQINRVPIVRHIVKYWYCEGWYYGVVLTLVLFVSLAFMLYHLGQFMSVDEPKWIYIRVPQLFQSLLTFDWAGTYINDKPGILPSFLSGLTLLPLTRFVSYSPESMELILFWWRFPIVIFNIVMLYATYLLLKRLFTKDDAILCTSLLALNPIIVGISQIVNPDATLWSTGFLCLLSFFIFLKERNDMFAILSGILLGLALLSKYFASFLYVAIFAAILIYFSVDTELTVSDLKQILIRYGIIIGVSIITYTLFFPATWVNAEQIWYGTFGFILKFGVLPIVVLFSILLSDIFLFDGFMTTRVRSISNRAIPHIFKIVLITTAAIIALLLLNSMGHISIFNLTEFMHNTNSLDLSYFHLLLASLYQTLYTLPLPLIILFGVSLCAYSFCSNSRHQKGTIKTTVMLSSIVFIGLFLAGSTLGGYLANSRYQILLYPIFSIIASIGVSKIVQSENTRKMITLVIIAVSILILLSTAPFYFQFNNALNIRGEGLSDPWGFGGYEIAQYLNQIPNAEHITIYTDREGFEEFFHGYTFFRSRTEGIHQSDYLLLSSGGERIFLKSLNMYDDTLSPQTKDYAYYAHDTQLLQMYEMPAEYEIILSNGNSYVKLVENTMLRHDALNLSEYSSQS